MIISIHAPPRGATRLVRRMGQRCGKFQFTPLREGRRAVIRGVNSPHLISIHAPPRGATGDASRQIAGIVISIHAPPRGATSMFCLITSAMIFQFTPLREGRPYGQNVRTWSNYFNSRPSARGDALISRLFGCANISIHAPPRGATRRRSRDGASVLFQFTPLREGRQLLIDFRRVVYDFNSRPSREGRPPNQRRSRALCNFNSRPSARGDMNGLPGVYPPGIFQFTPLREGRPFVRLPPVSSDTFQFTPLREGRHMRFTAILEAADFNSRPSARGDTAAT